MFILYFELHYNMVLFCAQIVPSLATGGAEKPETEGWHTCVPFICSLIVIFFF